MFCNSGFMPVEGFPSYMQGVVRVNPLSAVVEAMNACVGGGDGSVLPALFWLVGITTLGAFLLRRASARGH